MRKEVLADDGAGDARENWAPAYGVVLIVFDRVFSSQTETVTVPPMEVANIRRQLGWRKIANDDAELTPTSSLVVHLGLQPQSHPESHVPLRVNP